MVPLLAGDGLGPLVVQVDGVDQRPVDVELQLLGRRVPDTYGRRTPVALQMVQFRLGQVGAAVDAVHDLQGARGLAVTRADVPGDERHEPLGLLGEPQAQQRVHAERSVAHPHVPVVPVAFPAEPLGQTGRRRGHDRARRRVREQLQREGRAMHHLPPPPLVPRGRQPAPPVRHRRVELLLRLPTLAPVRRRVLGALVQREHRRLALGQLEVGPYVRAVGLQRDGGRQRQAQVTAGEDRDVSGQPHRVRHGTVAEARCHPRAERHGPADAEHPADQPVRAPRGRLAVDGNEVLHLADPVLGEEPGDQDVGVGEVELLGMRQHGRRQLEGTAPLGVQQRGEHTRRVEGRTAVPVDGAVGSHQRRAAQIADQSVVGDRRVPRLVSVGRPVHRSLPGAARPVPYAPLRPG